LEDLPCRQLQRRLTSNQLSPSNYDSLLDSYAILLLFSKTIFDAKHYTKNYFVQIDEYVLRSFGTQKTTVSLKKEN
jgi:hypothetical protein